MHSNSIYKNSFSEFDYLSRSKQQFKASFANKYRERNKTKSITKTTNFN